MQNFIAQTVVRKLSNRLHSKVTVGKIDYQLFDAISIKNLYVEDLHRDTLFYAKNTSAHFSFWKFFQGEIRITSFEFDQLHGNVVVDTLGNTNLDFIIKAFQKPQSNDSARVVYEIGHLGLRNSSFYFTNQKQNRIIPQGLINGKKLRFRKINADISLNVYDRDTLSAKILNLSAIEQSGLVITDISTQIMGSHTGVSLPYFNLKLPNSQLQLENIKLKYDSLADLKQFAGKVRWNAPLNLSHITLSDLKAFVPEFKNTRGTVTIKGLISGRISSLRFQKMEIKYGKSFLMKADMDINGLTNISEAFIYGQINELRIEKNDLQDFISDISRRPFLLPKELNQLGIVHYKGNVTGFLSNLVAYGNVNTNLGSVSTDILIQLENKLKDLKYNGTIKSKNFQLGKLLANTQLGKISFNVNTQGSKKENAFLQGTIKAKVAELQFNNYAYRDIQFKGKYGGNGFDGEANVQDENINAHFNGVIDLRQKLPVFAFDLKVKNTNLNALNLINKYPGAILSFNGKTNMVGNSLDNINGYVDFDSISFTNRNKTLHVEKIQFISRIEQNITRFSVASDYLNGSLNGNFKYSSIVQTVNQVISNYLPALAKTKRKSDEKYPNYIDVDLKIANTENISDVFELPYKLERVSTVKGYIDVKSNQMDLVGDIPLVKYNKQQIENITLRFQNTNKQLQLTTRAQLQEKNGTISLYLLASASNDSVSTQLGWQNTQQITQAGEILMNTKFRKENGKIAANIFILPTQVIISDSVWDIHRSQVALNADSSIQIRNFRFDNKKQFVHIDGTASHNPSDSMTVEMNDLNLDFLLFNIAKIKGIQIGGYATGKVKLKSLFTQPIYEANLFVKDVTLNHKLISDANLFSTWDKVNKQVFVSGVFLDHQKDTVALASGAYIPKTDSLDFMIDARKMSIEFLSPYLESVVQNVKGFGNGKVRMFGNSKNIGFEGDILANIQASVKVLKTTYFINDSVHLTRKAIRFKNVTVYDQERNPAKMTGLLTHNGSFKEMEYQVELRGKNILALNTQAEDNDYFFGKAYANGTVRIFGDEKEANIVINAISQPHTKCFVQMGGASKASDNSFINFKSNKNVSAKELAIQKPASNFNVKVSLQLEVTPNADMELIVDPKAGDMITSRGNGNLRLEFDTFSDIKLFGTYIINNGYYLFTMQNVFRKEFKIDQGSTISWTGSPFDAQVNIRALYPLTVSLKDLASSQLSNDMRSTVPVNCVLKLSDNLMKPTIDFDIDLPQSDEAVKQLVRNIVNTEEMMNRQILYLLVFNKFYTPDYMRTANTNTNFASNEGLSFFTSTVSAQLNNWLKQAFSNFTVGLDYQKSSQTNRGEYQAQILYQPNNRIIVNGNLGYRNDNLSNNTNRFIGDVDFEYLLNDAGKLRFKAYNHTVDRYYLGSAKLSQGLGFIYKEDFDSYDALFKYYWRLLGGNKKKTEDATKK